MSLQGVILAFIGVFIGYTWFGFHGLVLAGLLGYLLGTVIDLQTRFKRLEEDLLHSESRITEKFKKSAAETSSDEHTVDMKAVTREGTEPSESEGTVFHEEGVSEELEFQVEPDRAEGTPKDETQHHIKKPAKTLPIFSHIRDFFTHGNVIVRVGLIILFIGVAFLLKYAADRNRFPIEVRFIGVALAALVMLIVGWRIRLKVRTYALLLQGGAIGILYITVFAASRLYELVPLGFAFGVMVALVILSGMLAVLQNARTTVVMGIAGGFLAPVFTSAGGGSHVMLFSYYAILSGGILGIAWFKAWRELNVLGFLFTMTIGSAWGFNYYQPDFFATTEPFLILFFLYYVAVSVLYAFRQPPQLKGYVDGTLVFGVPIVAFTLQTTLVKDMEYALAMSALAASGFYICLASALWHRRVRGMRLLTEAFLALAVVFGSLAIPLALDGRWTSAAWAMEGAALVWIGIRQNRISARLFGLLLQTGAGIAFFLGLDLPVSRIPVLNGVYLGFIAIAFAGLFSSFYLQRHGTLLKNWERFFHPAFLVWGLTWWFSGGLWEIHQHVNHLYYGTAWVLLFAFSAPILHFLHRRFHWPALLYPIFCLILPLTALALWEIIIPEQTHPFRYLGYLAWPSALSIQYYLLRQNEGSLPKNVLCWQHRLGLWLSVFLLTWESSWAIGRLVEGAGTWNFIAWGIVPGIAASMILFRGRNIPWPVKRHFNDYLGMGLAPMLIYIWLWCLWGSVSNVGDPWPLPYVPIINPLELSLAFVLLVLITWSNRINQDRAGPFENLPQRVMHYTLAISLFIALNSAVARIIHYWADVSFAWHELFSSTLFQASLSVLWGLVAMGIMAAAKLKTSREAWFAGTTLLAIVVVKLFLLDLSGTGTIARIVSFVVVGIFMLLIGFFSPLPPRHGKEKAA